MRKALYSSVAALIAFAPVQSKAVEVNEAGAKEVLEKLTYYLPQKLVDEGFIKIAPATNRYELTTDFGVFLKDADPKVFTLNGLKPFVSYLTPQDDGLWKLESKQGLNINGQVTAGPETTKFSYAIEEFTTDALFDPATTFIRSASHSAGKITVNSETGAAKIKAEIGHSSGDTRVENVQDGKADIVSNVTFKDIAETIENAGAPTGPVGIKIASIDGHVQMDKVELAAFRDLMTFGLDLIKQGKPQLTAEEGEKLKNLIRSNLPLVDNLSEDIHLRDVAVTSQGMTFNASDVGYKIAFNGIKSDSRFGIEFSVTDPVVPAGLMPPGTEAAIPKSASFGFAITDLNLEAAAHYLVDNADFTKKEPLTPEQEKELGKLVMPSGKMHLEFSNVTAKSDVYDLALSGKIVGDPESTKEEVDVDMTLVARDFDKTVQFLQTSAAQVPEFGQAAFFVLMMKGFGKAEADGSLVWQVRVAPDGNVTINGQPFKM